MRVVESYLPACWELLGYCRCGEDVGHGGKHICNGCGLMWDKRSPVALTGVGETHRTTEEKE